MSMILNSYRFDDIVENETKADFEVTVTSEMMDQFLAISGDNNPMHVDSDYAKSKGYPDRLVYGMMTASFYSTLVGVYLPGKYCLLQELETSFYNPVYIGDSLTINGVVTEKNWGLRRIAISAKIVNQSGKRISKAKIMVGCLE